MKKTKRTKTTNQKKRLILVKEIVKVHLADVSGGDCGETCWTGKPTETNNII